MFLFFCGSTDARMDVFKHFLASHHPFVVHEKMKTNKPKRGLSFLHYLIDANSLRKVPHR